MKILPTMTINNVAESPAKTKNKKQLPKYNSVSFKK